VKKLKVGIAGYGVVGKRRQKCIEGNPNLTLTAVCDRTFETEETFQDGIYKYKDYKRLLHQELDILIVCMTNDFAPVVTIAGIKKGLHVFCEKPPGRSVAEVKLVMDAEKLFPRCKLMYGFNHRYHNSVKEALKIKESGELGKIINMRGVYGKSQMTTFDQPDWRTKREIAGGGILLDQGIHMVDLMRLFAGEFTEIKSFISNTHWGYDVEDNAYALMKTEKGIVAMLNSSATQWRHRFSLDINFEHGSLVLGGILSSTKSYGSETLTVVRVDRDNGGPSEQVTRYDDDSSWEDEITYFTDVIMNNKSVVKGSSEDALRTLELVNMIYYADPIWRNTYSIPKPKRTIHE
jgi:predicted dehydrogenase